MTLSNVNIVDETFIRRKELLLKAIEEEGLNLLKKIRFDYKSYNKCITKELLFIQELLEKEICKEEDLEKINERITTLTYKQINI
jgi:argininosuccinate lyase